MTESQLTLKNLTKSSSLQEIPKLRSENMLSIWKALYQIPNVCILSAAAKTSFKDEKIYHTIKIRTYFKIELSLKMTNLSKDAIERLFL